MDRHLTGTLHREIITPPAGFVGWRGLHVPEGGRMPESDNMPKSDNMPGIIPPIDQSALRMTEEIQWLSFNVMKYFHPATTPDFWTKQHTYNKAMTNGPQNGYGGGMTLANFITGKNKDAPLPAYDKKQRTFEGTFIRGNQVGAEIHCIPGEHCIDARQKPLPDTLTIVKNNWFVIAVNVGHAGNNYRPDLWAQAYPDWLVFPLISDEVIRYEARWFAEWNSDRLPDPVTLYNPL